MRHTALGLLAFALLVLAAKPARPQPLVDLVAEKALEVALNRAVDSIFPVPSDTPIWAVQLHEDMEVLTLRLDKLSADIGHLQQLVEAQQQIFAHNDLSTAIKTAGLYSKAPPRSDLDKMEFAAAVYELQNSANKLLGSLQCALGRPLTKIPAPGEIKYCNTYTEVALLADAMAMEAALYSRGGTSREGRFAQYERYFDQALSSDDRDTLRRIWTVFYKEALTRQLALDATAARGSWLCNIGSSHRQDPGAYCRYGLYQKVKGSLDRGYCFADDKVVWLYSDECKPNKDQNDREEHHHPHGELRYVAYIVPAVNGGADPAPATPGAQTIPMDTSGLFSRGLEETKGPEGCVGQAALQGDGQGPPRYSVDKCPAQMTLARQEYQRAATNANYVYMLIQLACRARQAAGELSQRFDPSWHGKVIVCNPTAYADPLPDTAQVVSLNLR